MQPINKKYLIIGAHPDDADLIFGGCAVKLARLGHAVKFVACVNGDAGHYAMTRPALATRRKNEAQAAAKIAGVVEYHVLDHHDCEFMPTLENRHEIIRLIREFAPHVIVTHRLCDYHTDHRATAQLVQDAAYLLNVPMIVPETPIMPHYPVILLAWDKFQKPCPFVPDLAVAIDDVLDIKLAMLDCHVSQFYEWLPYNQGRLDQVPTDPAGRRRWLLDGWVYRNQTQAELARALLAQSRGAATPSALYAETFEISEYGRIPMPRELAELFPF